MTVLRLGWATVLAALVLDVVGCAGKMDTPPEAPAPCAIGVFAKNCAAIALCHASPDSPSPGDIPALPGFDLSPAGIKAANDGASFVGRKASDDPVATCGASAKPPVVGKFIVDPNNPEASLLYEKLSDKPSCGARMPQVGKALSAAYKQCILDWIEKLPGVNAGGSSGASDAAAE